MVFEAGAKEVHLGISSPPIKHQIFMGLIPQIMVNC